MTAIKIQWTSQWIHTLQLLICLNILPETQRTWTQMVTLFQMYHQLFKMKPLKRKGKCKALGKFGCNYLSS